MQTALTRGWQPARRRQEDTRPGPRGLPLLGVMHKVQSDPLRYFTDAARTYGDTVWFDIGLDRVVMLNNPEHIKHVLQDNHLNYRKSKFYRPLKPLLGRGIFVSEGKEWIAQRRSGTPAFAGNRFEGMAAQLAAVGERRLQRWGTYGRTGESFDISREMMRLTFEGVATTLLGCHLDEDEYAAFHDAVTLVFRYAERAVWSGGLISHDVMKVISPRYREAVRAVDRTIFGIIEDRRGNPGAPADLLGMLMSRCNPDEQEGRQLLRDQVISFLVAGHETTAVAMTWVWHLLAQNPDVEARLHREVDDALEGAAPRFSDLAKLPLSRMVFEEAMRLYPPVWTISREAIEDDRIGDVDIPAGTTTMLCAYSVHRDPRFWPDPDRFDPERFSPETVETRPRFCYFPFAGGPRNCLGNRFAIMEAQIFLAMIAQRYQVKVADGQTIVPEPAITLRPRNGLQVTLKERQ